MKPQCIIKLLLLGGGMYLLFSHFMKKQQVPVVNPPVDSGFDDYTDYEFVDTQSRISGPGKSASNSPMNSNLLPRQTRDASV
jgi:hypothetical protein